MRPLYIEQPGRRLPYRRLLLFLCILLAMFILVAAGGVWRVNDLLPQVKAHQHEIYYRRSSVPAHRGNILDRNGRLLATSVDEYRVGIDAVFFRQFYDETATDAAAARLSEALELPTETVREKLRATNSYAVLKKDVSPYHAAVLKKLAIKGLRVDYNSNRFYPNGEVFAHLVGFVNENGKGRGIEYVRHEQLLADAGQFEFLRGRGGEALQVLDFKPAKNGVARELSIDSRLQFFAHQALRRAVAKHRAQGAAAIVMDVRDGALLAVASYPSFNPNNIRRSDLKHNNRNRALSETIEPGSTVKPFVVALALARGAATAEEVLPTRGILPIGRLRVGDSHVREDLNAGGVLRRSSNIGAVLLAQRVGKRSLHDWYETLGLGGGRLLAMPEEGVGTLRNHREWRREDFATHAYGYGLATSMLQLLRAYTIFATDGRLLNPFVEKYTTPRSTPVLAPATARQVRTMLEGVVSVDGTAAAAAIDGYRVAGKTGTTFKFYRGEYNDEKKRAVFVGMAPASAPRYLIAVLMDEPTENGTGGGTAAAPVFRDIMHRALLLGGVPPDNLPPADAEEINV